MKSTTKAGRQSEGIAPGDDIAANVRIMSGTITAKTSTHSLGLHIAKTGTVPIILS